MNLSNIIAIVAVVVATASAAFTCLLFLQGRKDAFQSISEVILREKNSFLEAYRALCISESVNEEQLAYLLNEHASNYCNAFEIACQLYLRKAITPKMFEDTFKSEVKNIYKGNGVAKPIKEEINKPDNCESIKKVAEKWGIAN